MTHHKFARVPLCGRMPQDLVANRVALPALMTAGRWKSARMPAR